MIDAVRSKPKMDSKVGMGGKVESTLIILREFWEVVLFLRI